MLYSFYHLYEESGYNPAYLKELEGNIEEEWWLSGSSISYYSLFNSYKDTFLKQWLAACVHHSHKHVLFPIPYLT